MESLDRVAIQSIFDNLSDRDLAKFCSTNQRIRNFCLNNDVIWQNRLLKYVGKFVAKMESKPVLEILNDFRSGTWKDLYLSIMNSLNKEYIEFAYNKNDKFTDDLIRIMNNEPFNIYNRKLYQNDEIDENLFYNKFDLADKRWIAPDLMLFYIMNGNIKQEKNIEEIFRNIQDNLNIINVHDIIANTLGHDHRTYEPGYKKVSKFLESLIPKIKEESIRFFFYDFISRIETGESIL